MVSFIGGSEIAFDQLVNRYSPRITNFILRQVAHYATAQEIAQDTFLAVYRKAHTFKPGHKFSSWLYAIAINFCRMHFRKMKSTPSILSFDDDRGEDGPGLHEFIADGDESASEALGRKEAENMLQEAILSLPAKQRLAFTLSFYEGKSYNEIGTLLGCSPGTVASRKHTAVKRLAAKLRKVAPDLVCPEAGLESSDLSPPG